LIKLVPIYQFQEFHSLEINGNGDQVYRAIKDGRSQRDFTLPYPGLDSALRAALPEGILNIPKGQPVLEVAS
jgi:HSP20 family molecular chaperone IbpA